MRLIRKIPFDMTTDGGNLRISILCFVKDMSETLSPIYLSDEEFAFYLKLGEAWFLDACLLQQYEINRIKQVAL